MKQAGFRNTDISVLFPENVGSKDFGHEKGSKAPEGAATGAGAGAALGGALGWLVGIGALAIPGLGLFVAAGPIMAALAGMGVGGAAGGIAGVLVGLGIPEYVAKRYEGRVETAEFFFLYIRTIWIGRGVPRTSWSGQAHRIFPPVQRPAPTTPRAIGRWAAWPAMLRQFATRGGRKAASSFARQD